MINKSFLGYAATRLRYSPLTDKPPEVVRVPLPDAVTLFSECGPEQAALVEKKKTLVRKKDVVKTGQRLPIFEGDSRFITATVTGTVNKVALFTGLMGRKYVSVTIGTAQEEICEEGGGAFDAGEDRLGTFRFVTHLPGRLKLLPLSGPLPHIHTLVINGTESDLLVVSGQHTLKFERPHLEAGIAILKKLYGAERAVVVVTRALEGAANGLGDRIHLVSGQYPSGASRLVAKELLGRAVPAQESILSQGLAFVSAETAAAAAKLAEGAEGPFNKKINVVRKDGSQVLVTARIGTPVGSIIERVAEELSSGDHLIAGGPLTGTSIYDAGFPVTADLDALIVHGPENMPKISDYACINCGKCIRICPAKVPVNLLVRYLEAGRYEEADGGFNLNSCIECGLCSYICVSKKPLMQLIKLGRARLAVRGAVELKGLS